MSFITQVPGQRPEDRAMVDPESPVFRIFHQLFNVIMPVMQVRSIEDIQQRGMVASGDARYDAAMKAERGFYWQTIAQLVEFHRKAVAIRLVKPTDAAVIYELVQAHLEDWAQAMKHSFNIRTDQVMIDDLLAMEAFAQAVYPRAQEHSRQTSHFDDFARGFLGLDRKPKSAKNTLGLAEPGQGLPPVRATLQRSTPDPVTGTYGDASVKPGPFDHLRQGNRLGQTAPRYSAPGTPVTIPARNSLESVFRQRKIQHDPIFHRQEET